MFANKDYIIRIIEQFVQAFLSIIRARKAGKHDDALEQIQTASRLYLDADISLLLTYESNQLLDHFRKADKTLDTERCIICADLIHEVALISDAKHYDIASSRLKTLSLHLYLNVILIDNQFKTPEYMEKVDTLRKELGNDWGQT